MLTSRQNSSLANAHPHCPARSGHQSFSNSRSLNDLVGNVVHSFILVPYHGWRISHRTHHANHGHVENDESWHPVTKSTYEELEPLGEAPASSGF